MKESAIKRPIRAICIAAALALSPTLAPTLIAADTEISAFGPVKQHEIRFQSDDATLAGTLYTPEGAENGPALVVVQQANTTTRDNPFYTQIAEVFTTIGHSVFLYDRRGQGESEGTPDRPRYHTMAADAVAAKRAIAEHEAVDPTRIGYWGLSQGGWLAMEAANISNPAFVISVSAPLTTPAEQMEVLAYNALLVDGHGEQIADKALRIRRLVMDDYYRGRIEHDEAREAIESIEDEPWFELVFLPASDQLPEDIQQTSWIHEMDYDPIPAFEAVEAPLLFLLGTEDFTIPLQPTLDVLDGHADRPGLTVAVIPAADHVMRKIERRKVIHEGPSTSPAYFMTMGTWLGELHAHRTRSRPADEDR